MAAGDRLLHTSGQRILDATGNRVLSDGAADECCCMCVVSCPVDPDPECCLANDIPTLTPDAVSLTIGGVVPSPKCDWDTAPPYHVWKVFCAGLIGVTFSPVPFVGDCLWQASFVVTGLVGINFCVGDGTGCVCEPGTSLGGTARLDVTITTGGAMTLNVFVDTETAELGSFFLHTGFGVAETSSWSSCCEPWTVLSTPPVSGMEDWNTLWWTEATPTPCP